jgi:hypothetical protein
MLVTQDDPQQTVQIFIDLIQRHEQSFYFFVHKVHSKGAGLFSGLMRWIELFLDIVREGLGEPISLEFILPHTGDERRDAMKEIDEVALHHYKLKVAYETKLRRRFGRAGGADISGDDETAREIVGGLVRDVSIGDFMKGGMLDVAAEAEEEESSNDSEEFSSDYESDADDSENGSEESSVSASRPPTQFRTSPSTPTLPKSSPRRAQESFPPSQPSKSAVPPPPAKPPSPQRPERTPSVASPSPSSTGTRLRKISLTLRKSRSMTFGATRPASSNNAETPPPPPVPPVPSLPQSAARSRSAVQPTASGSKQLPALPKQPQSSSAGSPSRRPPAPNAHARTSEKRYPSKNQNQPQAPPKRQSKPASGAPKPPELKKIAELLPLFVEMVCPEQNSSPLPRAALMFLLCLFRRCAPRYVHGNDQRDSQGPILRIEFVCLSTIYSSGTTENFVFFSTTLRTLHAKRKIGYTGAV